jgi:hypothetical protein
MLLIAFLPVRLFSLPKMQFPASRISPEDVAGRSFPITGIPSVRAGAEGLAVSSRASSRERACHACRFSHQAERIAFSRFFSSGAA